MDKTIFERNVIKIINREIEKLKEKNNLFNLILRNDVFMLLEAQDCTVLYYPLDDKIEGFRVQKYVNGKEEEFIYINTAKAEDIQIFTAAHELGHLINIDKIVCNEVEWKNPLKKVREDIIDRFAAELLMEKETFIKLFIAKGKNYVDQQGMISGENMLRTIAYLMDTFMVPYDSVVRRLWETERINENVRDLLLDKKNVSESLIEKAIEEGNYKRLKPTKIKSFGCLTQYLKKLDEAGEISERRLQKIMNVFEIKEFEIEDIPFADNIQLEKGMCDE